MVYIALQAIFVVIVKFLPKTGLPGQVKRVVVVNIVNHLFYIGVASLGIALSPEAAKITAAGAIWAAPAGIALGFFFFVSFEVASRLGRKIMGQVLFDLQELAVSPIFPRHILVPGLFNYVVLKPLSEELLFRGVMIGVLSTQIHWGVAILLTVIVENLRYPQLTWLGKNTLRAIIPGLLFLISPTILLTMAMGIMAHALGAVAQTSRVRKLAESLGGKTGEKEIAEFLTRQASTGKTGNKSDKES